MTYTPGPWELLPLQGKYYGSTVRIGEGEVRVWQPLGTKYAPSIREIENGWTPEYGFDHVETQESFATALLISKAPALLAQLSDLVEIVEQAIQSGDWIVDGCCDPDITLSKAKYILDQLFSAARQHDPAIPTGSSP